NWVAGIRRYCHLPKNEAKTDCAPTGRNFINSFHEILFAFRQQAKYWHNGHGSKSKQGKDWFEHRPVASQEQRKQREEEQDNGTTCLGGKHSKKKKEPGHDFRETALLLRKRQTTGNQKKDLEFVAVNTEPNSPHLSSR